MVNMPRKWMTKYGLAAVIAAVLVIAVALVANPNFMPAVSAKTSLAVMLTDPPTVPAGTTQLNITYSNISLHVIKSDGTSEWISAGTGGTVNSFALVNMTQTIASITIPFNSSVDKIQFNVDNVKAQINGATYNVTTLSNTLVLRVANSQINQTLSGLLVDFNPTLLQIQSVDANGNPVSYYVLVPSATATVVNGLDQAQIKVGTIVRLGENDRFKMTRVVESFAQDVQITSASLSVSDNSTALSVTLQNNGDLTFRIFGAMLSGQFNTPFNTPDFGMPGMRNGQEMNTTVIPFRINGTSLIPPFAPGRMQPMMPLFQGQGDGPQIEGTSFDQPIMGRMQGIQMIPRGQPMVPPNGMRDDRTGAAAGTYVALQPGETVTLTFNGVLALPYGFLSDNSAIIPIVGNNYTIQLTGEGFQTYTVTATA